MVHEAEEEELHSPSLECAKIAGLLNYFTATEYYEPPVIFRLLRPRVDHTFSLSSPRSVDCEEYQEAFNFESVEETKANVSKIDNNTTEKCCIHGATVRQCPKEKDKSPEVYIRAQDQ